MGKTANLTITFMKKEDLDQVMAIEQVSFSMPWSRNLFLSEFRSPSVSRLLVALVPDAPMRTIAGYLVFWLVAGEMHILDLATAPGSRQQGIARRLVLAGLRHGYSKEARRAFLEVRASNEPAHKLYSSLGFTATFIRRDYYDDPIEDAVVMTLEEGAFASLVASLQKS